MADVMAYLMRLETRLQCIISNDEMLVSVSTTMEHIAWKTTKLTDVYVHNVLIKQKVRR